ncbi:ESX secretion-associated protein EspG [Saccharopolyspora gregorii]|uniref:ESX secretion-associated protein EspG n=1 Tax=Saccharopolyspora gregorii TaxID=33914 RepID=UPI0021AC32E0|nr:ESX secretion-associated protein EspG [Saccharopolyspora gregorii]
MGLVGRWRLAPLHSYLVRRYLGVDDLALPLEGAAFGRTRRQLRELARREAPAMHRAGLLVDDEAPVELAEALRVLAGPQLWVDSLWCPEFGGEAAWRSVAALTGRDRVVLGVQEPGEGARYGGALTVELHQRAALSEVLLATLPPAPPGTRGRVRVPESSLRSGPEELATGFLQHVAPVRGSSGDRLVEQYRSIGSGPHLRAGQFAASARDPRGARRRSAVVRWFDNAAPDGRYLDHAERGGAGERVHALTPADVREVRIRLEALVDSVR